MAGLFIKKGLVGGLEVFSLLGWTVAVPGLPPEGQQCQRRGPSDASAVMQLCPVSEW